MDLQATYSVLDLKLSMLIEEIDKECKQGMIDILHFKILLYFVFNTYSLPFLRDHASIDFRFHL